MTNSFDAEQGPPPALPQISQLKSGTEPQFHGNAREYNTISGAGRTHYFPPVTQKSVPKYILNQFGVNFGGPIIHNRAFFLRKLGARSRRSQNQSGFQTVPRGAMRNGNFHSTGATIYDPATEIRMDRGVSLSINNIIPAPRIAYAASQMMSIFPQANVATSVLSANYFTSVSGQYTRDIIDSRR